MGTSPEAAWCEGQGGGSDSFTQERGEGALIFSCSLPLAAPICSQAVPLHPLPPASTLHGVQGRNAGEPGPARAFSCSSDFPALSPPAFLSAASSPGASTQCRALCQPHRASAWPRALGWTGSWGRCHTAAPGAQHQLSACQAGPAHNGEGAHRAGPCARGWSSRASGQPWPAPAVPTLLPSLGQLSWCHHSRSKLPPDSTVCS